MKSEPPFDFALQPHQRRHDPQGYADYASYREWLRDEFNYRCAYCLSRENWGPPIGSFHLDHMIAVVVDASLRTEYRNLVYACCTCNLAKGKRRLPDPTQVAIGTCLRVDAAGYIHAIDANGDGQRLIDGLGLKRRKLREWRAKWLKKLRYYQKHADDPECQELMIGDFGYPVSNLTNLAKLAPPGGNTQRRGICDSAYALQKRGKHPRFICS